MTNTQPAILDLTEVSTRARERLTEKIKTDLEMHQGVIQEINRQTFLDILTYEKLAESPQYMLRADTLPLETHLKHGVRVHSKDFELLKYILEQSDIAEMSISEEDEKTPLDRALSILDVGHFENIPFSGERLAHAIWVKYFDETRNLLQGKEDRLYYFGWLSDNFFSKCDPENPIELFATLWLLNGNIDKDRSKTDIYEMMGFLRKIEEHNGGDWMSHMLRLELDYLIDEGIKKCHYVGVSAEHLKALRERVGKR